MEANSLELPAALEAYRKGIEASVKPYVRIKATAHEAMNFHQSKFGGLPYLPEDREYPLDQQGKPLIFLAQIHCPDLPPLDLFPQKGMLQFYVADDAMYGLDLDEPAKQKNFRVIYFSEVEQKKYKTDFDFLPDYENSPLRQPYALHFEQNQAPAGLEDIYFDTVFGDSSYGFFKKLGAEGQEMRKIYADMFSARGHKMGGYAHFTQEDPRWIQEAFADAVLLLQIDSDGSGIQWGDQGVAHFFILPEDLRKLDFSSVLYNWDSP